ncbi:hypothetical protein JXM67_12510 [candidate division WOR-3 bacterium]|nr:hypothetical protein [candidate division WOR-3 bacterium]
MAGKKRDTLVPFELVEPGYEAVWIGKKLKKGVKLREVGESTDGAGFVLQEGEFADDKGNIYNKWSLWSHAFHESEWDSSPKYLAIRYINEMQEKLGPLSDDVRRIRAQIASLVHCDSGFPVTVDELLASIGTGKAPRDFFYAGCWLPKGTRTTQPRQAEAMAVIEEALLSYLDGQPAEEMLSKYPFAKGFVERTYEWLGPRSELSDFQELMLKRLLLPFDFFSRRNTSRGEVTKRCFEDEGEGSRLDAGIATLGGLPDLNVDWEIYQKNMETLTDPAKKNLYRIAYTMRLGVPLECDCHHATFRKIERWIYGIGTGEPVISSRIHGTERKRLRQLLFGYALALDKWLLGIPMQFLLLDLGHIDLGLDIKNEVLRVYAHLGGDRTPAKQKRNPADWYAEATSFQGRTPVKEWLAACLWHNMCYNTTGGWEFGILNGRHVDFYREVRAKGVEVDSWISRILA